MILLSVNEVSKHFGPEPVLEGVTLEVRRGEKISLVGPNGAGKTTLLKILVGREEADAGTVSAHASARVELLEQQPRFTAGGTVWDEAADGLRELRGLTQQAEELARAISRAEDDRHRRELGQRYDHLQHELQRRDGYQLDHRIERVLQGLGFPQDSFRQSVAQLSGGQQNRLLLAKLLLREPDLMLLDEPSNHLDIEASEWLEDFLIQSPSAVLVVSHDRYFLDRVTGRTLELLHGTVESYTGNFSAYRRQKAERLEVERRTYEKQQTEIAKLEDFVRRHHYGQKHAQAEDRRKKLERIERLPPPREISAPAMRFAAATRCGDVALRVERLAKAYDTPLFGELSFDILRGERWGILGPNACGKTTLLHCLLGRAAADEGRAVFAANVQLGYFDQHLADLADDRLVVDAIRVDHKEFVDQQRRDLLARFGITGEMVHQRVGSLSGGERNRTALARLAALDANFLILDEPTNHLDLWSRAALEDALRTFEGTVLMVSHDRYFLNQVVDHLLVFHHGDVRVIDGNYEMYLRLLRQASSTHAAAAQSGDARPPKDKARTRSQQTAKRPKRKFPYRKLAELEADIQRCEQQIAELHAQLASPEVLRDGAQVRQLKSELDEQNQALASLYEHWEEAIELN